MQILVTWKAKNLSKDEAHEHWRNVLERWKSNYQPLVGRELRLATAQSRSLFLALLHTPGIFREWQEFYQDERWAVAWSGLAHNLIEHVSPGCPVGQMNSEFIAQFQARGEALLRNLNGRFTTAVLDRKAGRLHCITAHSGLTPCFRTEGRYGVALGTRIAPLLDLVGRKAIPDKEGMRQVFVLDWCVGERTVFEGVAQVDPGMMVILSEQEPSVDAHCYFPPGLLLEQAAALSSQDALMIGSDAVNRTLQQQMRHAKAPLMDLTGGLDSRAVVATAVGNGYTPECDVSGIPHSREMDIVARLSELMHITLHRFYAGAHYAEDLDHTLHLWSLWTEGMIPAHINFARSLGALSPRLRSFYTRYHQIFSGVGADYRHSFYGTEMLVERLSTDEVLEKLYRETAVGRFREEFLSKEEYAQINQAIRGVMADAIQMGVRDYRLIDYFYWRERVCRWGGYMTDMQQIGRHVYAPLCQPTLTAVFLSLPIEDNLAAAWHLYHIHRMMPALERVPFLSPPHLSGIRQWILQRVLPFHPASHTLYRVLGAAKRGLFSQHKHIPERDRQKIGTYFHAPLRRLLFSGDEWWPQIIPYQAGQRIWQNFVTEKEAKPLWNLVTFELWARNFLS